MRKHGATFITQFISEALAAALARNASKKPRRGSWTHGGASLWNCSPAGEPSTDNDGQWPIGAANKASSNNTSGRIQAFEPD